MEQPAANRAAERAEHDRNRHGGEIRQPRAAALRHPREGGKQHDHVYVVARCARHHHLRNALLDPAPFLHQSDHARHDNRRRDRAQHRAHDGGLRARNAQNDRRKQHDREHLERRGHKRHHHRRTTDALQIAQIERQPRAQQNQHQRQPAQFARNGEYRRIQQPKCIRSDENTDQQHANDARQPHLFKGRRPQQAEEEHKRQ